MEATVYLEDNEYIALCDLLKLAGLAESGGQAKAFIAEGLVLRNGETETRKTAKIRGGEVIEFDGARLEIADGYALKELKARSPVLGEPLLDEPVRPESWECCGSDCGDVCIQTVYWTEKALRRATEEIERSGLDGRRRQRKGRLKTVRLDGNRVFRRPFIVD